MSPRKLLSGALGLVLLACAPATEDRAPSESPRNGGTLVVAKRDDIDTINDLISDGSTQMRNVERLLFLDLMRENDDFRQGPSTYGPQLAERWEFSDDRLTLTFHLREASWSDGVPITADDVRWTWQAQTDERVAWRRKRNKESIRDVEVLDPKTVRFHFDASYPDQLENANTGAILPQHAWGELPFSEWRSSAGWFVDRIVSSGPFVLEEWRPSQEIVLRRNGRYYRPDRPRLDRLVFRVIPEKSAQVSQLIGGSIDYLMRVPADQIARLEAHPGIELEGYWGRQFDYLCWNLEHPPLDRAEVRRALTQAIDRQSIVDSIFGGYANVATTAMLSSTWAHDPSLEPWPYAPADAEAALEAAGLGEREGVRLRLELLAQSGNRTQLDAATLIQAQLARVGVVLELRQVEFQTWFDRVKAGEFQVAMGGWNIPSSLDMAFAFHTEEIGKFNFGRYSNPELDRLMDRARLAGDHDERLDLLHQVQAVLHRDQPYTFLWEPMHVDARRTRVRDSRPNALSTFYSIDEWWVAGEGRDAA